MIGRRLRFGAAAAVVVALSSAPAAAQFTNRYPKVAGFNHHIYLEGYELPVLSAGPSDPAVSPDGRRLAIAARGWLWTVAVGERRARRLTSGAALDARPAWSPDGRRLAFVRDDTTDTAIWEVEVGPDGRPGAERELLDTDALDLDPAWAEDGSLLYSSAVAGDLDVWRLDPATGETERLTRAPGLELSPLPRPGGGFLYLTKQRSGDSGLVLRGSDGGERTLWRGDIASQLRPDLGRDGRRVAATLPGEDRSRLMLLDTELPGAVHVAHRARLPLFPAFDPEGRHVYYVEADAALQFRLWRAPVLGGSRVDVTPLEWDWGVPTARVAVRSRWTDSDAPLPVRLEITDAAGHPLAAETGHPRFDSQSGRVFQYSPGWLSVVAPRGESVRVTATHGFHGTPTEARGEAGAGAIDLRLERAFDPAALGWYAGDHHWHLNYGGPWTLGLEDVLTELRAEALDVATPLVANLHTRFSDLELWDRALLGEGPPLVFFGQEVRAHLLGHVGLVGLPQPTWPWYWGPGYPAYSRLDRPNLETLRTARAAGAVTSYVHPVSRPDPFPASPGDVPMPLALIPDALSGHLDTLEIACLWSNERGTAEVWYRLLDLGLEIQPSAGTDAFPDFFRSMALGTARVYVHLPDGLDRPAYLDALREGRSFVTTGPFLRFEIGGRGPGGALDTTARGPVPWSIRLDSVIPVDSVDIVSTGGEVLWSGDGLTEPGSRVLSGALELPEAGWVAARAGGGAVAWPAMNAEVFAHTAPVWLGDRGETTPEAAARAAAELLPVMDAAITRLRAGYGDAPIPRLEARFRAARERLAELAR